MLPHFKYHPDPEHTGSVKKSGKRCVCCDQQRGYIYAGPTYAREELSESICPWCINSGDAASRYDALFTDDSPLAEAGLPEEVILEVSTRTPGYSSWQDPEWISHCGDACEFHGDLTPDEARAPDESALAELLSSCKIERQWWAGFASTYQRGGNPAVYKWVCRACRKITYSIDFT
jgi:uncharacterized protein CbrC (UPF0167 family)